MRALSLVALSFLLTLPGLAQDDGSAVVRPARPRLTPRPLGVYAGVEPGDAQPPPAYRRVTRRRARRRAMILTWPGFAPHGDGGSRFFVQTTEPLQPQLSVEQNRVVLLFRNTATHLRNSRRWLETRFFNTPVLRARLERRRGGIALVMHFRSGVAVTPRVSSEVAPGGTFHYVYIDFPPGDYAPVIAPPPEVRARLQTEPGSGPPSAPARRLDPSLDAMDNERPPGM